MLDFTISCGARRRLKAKKPEDSDAFSEVEYKHLAPAAVLTMHAIYVPMIYAGQ